MVKNRYAGKDIDGYDSEERYIPSTHGGPDIRIRIFRPKNSNKVLPALLYNHGGAYMSLVPEMFLVKMKKYLDARPCVVVTADYRLSVKAPFPAGFNDCYDTLLWMKEQADELKILPKRFIIAGDSAGGGMTAALTLKVRDTKAVDIAFQVPVCPMIDHRQITESARTMQLAPVYNSNDNEIGWRYYLEGIQGEVPAYASPALNTDYTGFPPTISIVGESEPFRDETIAYMDALKKAHVPVKFGLYKGGYHGFQEAVPEADVSKEASYFLFESFREYYDTYVLGQ
ncbi:alpha/beta hydrolase [bacterium SCSIO 12741]|nr:alpha/beta hydrolase [bacterium SCSIO 12741]